MKKRERKLWSSSSWFVAKCALSALRDSLDLSPFPPSQRHRIVPREASVASGLRRCLLERHSASRQSSTNISMVNKFYVHFSTKVVCCTALFAFTNSIRIETACFSSSEDNSAMALASAVLQLRLHFAHDSWRAAKRKLKPITGRGRLTRKKQEILGSQDEFGTYLHHGKCLARG